MLALHAVEERADLVFLEHRRQPPRSLGADDLVQPRQLDLEHALVEEEQRRKRLGLGGGRDVLDGREVRKEIRHLRRAHVLRMPPAVVDHEAADPVDVGALGAEAVAPNPDRLADAVDEAGLLGWWCRILDGDALLRVVHVHINCDVTHIRTISRTWR